jgi:signal transduction histidine kinase
MDETPPDPPPPTTNRREHAQRLHELRTPLTVVLGRVQLARRRLRRGDDPTRVEAELEAVEAAVARLAAVVERLDRGGPPD